MAEFAPNTPPPGVWGSAASFAHLTQQASRRIGGPPIPPELPMEEPAARAEQPNDVPDGSRADAEYFVAALHAAHGG